MAWIEQRKRRDGGVSARVVWRLGASREGAYQAESFSAGSDAQNLARADGFKKLVDAAGQQWPVGWVKGEGFVRPAGTDPLTAPPRFDEIGEIGEKYVRQIVDLSPGQRKRYLGQLQVLAGTRVRGSLVFVRPSHLDSGVRHQGLADRLGPVADKEPRLRRFRCRDGQRIWGGPESYFDESTVRRPGGEGSDGSAMASGDRRARCPA